MHRIRSACIAGVDAVLRQRAAVSRRWKLSPSQPRRLRLTFFDMSGSSDSKASAEDRERALRELAEHFSSGRLDLAEFDERTVAVSAAVTRRQLAEMFVDLPASSPPDPQEEVTNQLIPPMLLAMTLVALAIFLAVATRNWLWLLLGISIPLAIELVRRRIASTQNHVRGRS